VLSQALAFATTIGTTKAIGCLHLFPLLCGKVVLRSLKLCGPSAPRVITLYLWVGFVIQRVIGLLHFFIQFVPFMPIVGVLFPKSLIVGNDLLRMVCPLGLTRFAPQRTKCLGVFLSAFLIPLTLARLVRLIPNTHIPHITLLGIQLTAAWI